MRRRVIESTTVRVVRDQARGVYGIDGRRHRAVDSSPGAVGDPDLIAPISAEYIAQETGVEPALRNWLMTIAAVMTVAWSLALVGRRTALGQGAAQAEVTG